LDLQALVLVITLVFAWINRNAWTVPVAKWFYKRLRAIVPSPFRRVDRIKGLLASSSGDLALLSLRVEVLEEHSTTPLAMTDDKGELTWGNDAYTKLIGASIQDVEGFKWSTIIHQDDRNNVIQDWQRAVEYGTDWTYQFRFWSFSSGRVLWVKCKCTVAYNPLTKELCGWLCVFTPIEDPTVNKNECPNSHFKPPVD